jgi:hypothetical protein
MAKYHPNAIRIEPGEWFDDAIVGTSKDGFLIYSYYRLIEVHMRYMNESEEDSAEWINFNVIGLTCDNAPTFKVSYAARYQWKQYKPSCLKGLRKRK